MQKKAIIIGAGPAGLTAAYELLTRTDIVPIILEKSGEIGGISRTTNYKGNRMDMGPHRFFSKSDRVMDWWMKMMPLEQGSDKEVIISYQNKSLKISSEPADLKNEGKVMLVIQRLTRIYFLRKFFAYPIQLSIATLKNLGFVRTIKILLSFLWIQVHPRKPEKSLEDFIINKFGKQLYLLFFKDYTEKVWGMAPSEISAEWGAQRIKGVSLSKAVAEALKSLNRKKKGDIHQKELETSLIEQFLYPKYGPGSLWEEVARKVEELGGKIYLHQDVQRIETNGGVICSVSTINSQTGQIAVWDGEYFVSTMPVKELIAGMGSDVPMDVQQVAAGLQYRDFINVGILLKQLSTKGGERLELKDNWIYIQERDVKVGRLMIYNNWGGGMVKDPDTIWIGMEYFCNKSDPFWVETDETIQQIAIKELEQMGLAAPEDVLDSVVKRMEKTYPAYFGTFKDFHKVRAYADSLQNLFLVGRNGMHKYNNADHSMLTAMVAVDNMAAGITTKANIWAINTEQEYHEEKAAKSLAEEHVINKRRIKYPFLLDYLWNSRANRAWWLFGITAFLIEFVLFKFHYPFANYMPDSYSYLQAAADNSDVNMWPVAYSKYLRLLSVFTHSDKIVVGVQYIFMQSSTLIFVFSILFWLKPGQAVKNIILFFFVFDPLPLYVANYIAADALFVGFSLLWLTSLVWIIFKPQPQLIAIHAVALLACFMLRYNAIYYPFLAIFAFCISRQSWRPKVMGIAIALLLVSISFFYTSGKMKETSGKWQYSAFGGWQMANNALYMYQHILPSQRGPVPSRFAGLETMVREYMDTLNKVKFSREDSSNAFFYLWSGRGPLIQYLTRQYLKDSLTPYFKRWATEAPLYQGYGVYLIRQYPIEFVKEWMLPNAAKYVIPPAEFLGVYNMGHDSVGILAKEWFNYKTQRVGHRDRKQPEEIPATAWFPAFGTMANILLFMGLMGSAFLGAVKRKERAVVQFLVLVAVLWLVNAVFSIFASPIVLRYQIFPLFVAFTVGAVLIERIWRTAK